MVRVEDDSYLPSLPSCSTPSMHLRSHRRRHVRHTWVRCTHRQVCSTRCRTVTVSCIQMQRAHKKKAPVRERMLGTTDKNTAPVVSSCLWASYAEEVGVETPTTTACDSTHTLHIRVASTPVIVRYLRLHSSSACVTWTTITSVKTCVMNLSLRARKHEKQQKYKYICENKCSLINVVANV